MKLTKDVLREIIQEVLWDVMPNKKFRENPAEAKRERMDDIFAGINSLRSISKGIMEDEDGRICVEKDSFDSILNQIEQNLSLLDEACGDSIEGNRRHTISGEFGDKSNNTSWSLQDKGCGANKMSPGSNQRKWTKVPCGRAARRQQKNIRCRDGKELPL